MSLTNKLNKKGTRSDEKPIYDLSKNTKRCRFNSMPSEAMPR